jgi:hypothetical protein
MQVSWSFVFVWAHVVGAILLVGYCLFWAVMTTATRREFAASDALQLLQAARAATWPLPGVKLTLTVIGWLLLIFVSAAGLLSLPAGFSINQLVNGETFSTLLLTKLILLVALVACMPRLGITRTPLALLSLGLALAIVVTSALLVR